MANPYNFRIHGEKQQKWAKASLDEIGWIDEVKVNRNSGHMVDGHLRVTLAMRHDQEKVPVTYLDLTEQEEKKALAVYDRITTLAIEDEKILSELIQEIDFGDGSNLSDMFGEIVLEDNKENNKSSQPRMVTCPNCEYEFAVDEGKKA